MSDLNTLASNLRAQAATNSTIVLDSTVFSSDVLADIRTAFALATDANLTITGVRAADIPDPANGVLTISVGTASALNQSGLGIGLTFMESGDSLEAIVTATMSTSWKFSDSFRGLDIFPFQDLKTATAHFVYATVKQTAYPWPRDSSYSIPLEPGLNFLSDVTLDNFSVISTLLGTLIGSTPFKFYGPFAPTDGQPLPVGTIKAPLGTGSFGIGVAPHALTLANPAVAVRIDTSDTDNPLQNIDLLVEADYNNTLEFAVGIPMSGGTLAIGTKPLPNQSSINSLIESLPGGSGFTSYIPGELSSIFANVGLDNFAMVVNSSPKVTYLSLSISTLQPWTVISDVLVLEGLNLQIEIVDPTGMNWTRVYIEAKAEFLPDIFTGEFDFIIGLERQTSWEVSTVSGAYYGAVNLGDIVGGLLGNQDSVPTSLRAIKFSDFGVSATRSATGSPFNYSFYGSVEAAFPILDHALAAQLYLAVTKTLTSYNIHLSGSLAISDQTFTLTLDLGTSGSQLRATWTAQDKAYLELEDIASALALEAPEIPDGLDMALASASLTYDFTNKTLVIEVVSANFGNAVFVTFKNTTTAKWQFYFGLTVNDAKINLSNLPLVGAELPPEQTVSVDDLQILIASQNINFDEANAINKLIPDDIAKIPLQPGDNTPNDIVIRKGLNLSAKLQFGSTTETLALPVSADSADTQPTSPTQPSSSTPTSTSTSDNATWFKLQKTFGPIYFERVGVQYKDAVIWFLLDAALSAAGLSLDLEGLSVGSPLKQFDPKFDLRGLGIDYKSGPIEIDGAFLRGKITFEGKEYDDYSGTAIIRAKTLTLAAIGSYVQLPVGPSMFVYAVLDYPIGGPAFFFITGLAAGFGYNRELHVPPIDGIQSFPLVQEAMGGLTGTPNLADELAKLQEYIPPSVGNYFLAIGIRFSTFKMIDSFVLVSATFGHRFELDVLGLSTLVLPLPDAGKTVTPIAEVQLALRAAFIPDEGFFGISAQLTNNSFLLDRKCHLTGGFAFYSWFAGEHSGDFIITVGGYHPHFSPPSHYPTVPRLGFNWQVNSDLNFKGSAYYALASSALMAGGNISATWEDGSLKAWFDAGINFLISWKPYHYEADFHISIGASYTFWLFGTQHITVSVGADVSIWGPEFAGKAHISLWIISFTISFGASDRNQINPIPWTQFRDSFLPEDDKICTINLKAGLIDQKAAKDSNDEQQTDGEDLGIVNPKTLCLTTDSAIPLQSVSLGSKNLDHTGATTSFNIGTMQLSNDRIISTQCIIITRDDNPVKADFNFQPLTKNVPAALWGSRLKPSLQSEQMVPNLLIGYEIHARRPAEAPHAAPISYATLQQAATLDREDDAFRWSQLIPFVAQPLNDKAARQEIDDTLKNNDVASKRTAITNALFDNIDLNLDDFKADDFLSAPQVNQLTTRAVI
ncbi:MAG: hypothetical protein EBE86_012100 [Hormoscilla sp. GUM202]|nr:hypothetical protein [Hormoscilla sp. GUM202]